MFDFSGKSVLITGAGSGIGKAAALLFSQSGAMVAVNSFSSSGALVAKEICENGGKAIFVQGDVSVEGDAKEIVERTANSFSRLDIVVNNAGTVCGGNAETTDMEDWERVMAVNVKGTLLISKYAVPYLRAVGGGSIINNASLAAIKGLSNRVAYAASKGAVLSMSRAMAADYCHENIRVNCVSPGTISTPLVENQILAADDPKQLRERFISRQPIGRLGTSEEVAKAMLFLASDEVSFMDGMNLIIDGGASSL